MNNSNLELLLTIFVALTGLAVLMQALVLLGIFLTARKALTFVTGQAEEYRAKINPLIESGNKLVETGKDLVTATTGVVKKLEPQLEAAANDLSDITHSLREQTHRLQAQTDQIASKVRSQADRVDDMTTSVLNGVDRAGRFLNEAVSVPLRQVNGVVAAAKAVVETLRTPPPPRAHRVNQEAPVDEKDLFV